MMGVDSLRWQDLSGPMRTLASFAAAVMLGVGCAAPRPDADSPKPKPSPDPATTPATNAPPRGLIVTPDYSVSGRVAAVDLEGSFVVLDFSVTGMPVIGQRLVVLRSGREVAEVRVSGPQRDNQIAADILRGAPRVGDAVREY